MQFKCWSFADGWKCHTVIANERILQYSLRTSLGFDLMCGLKIRFPDMKKSRIITNSIIMIVSHSCVRYVTCFRRSLSRHHLYFCGVIGWLDTSDVNNLLAHWPLEFGLTTIFAGIFSSHLVCFSHRVKTPRFHAIVSWDFAFRLCHCLYWF